MELLASVNKDVMLNATESGVGSSNMLPERQSEVRVTSKLWNGLVNMKYIWIHYTRV